jgi:hypothetical protein
VIPGTALGLVLFVASLGPGFVYVRVAERYGPRADRSQLEEAVEMLVVGAVVSSISALTILWAGHKLAGLDTDALSTDAQRYLVRHPGAGFGAVACFLTLGYALGALLGWIRFAGRERPVKTNTHAWHRAFYEDRPEHTWAFVTLELDDGSRVSGSAWRWTAEFNEHRELLLLAPLAIQAPTGERRPLQQEFFIVREDKIRTIQGHYVPASDDGTAKSKRRLLRRRTAELSRDARAAAAEAAIYTGPSTAPSSETT